jgi:hypothetical protein
VLSRQAARDFDSYQRAKAAAAKAGTYVTIDRG